jgi:hypothetical protein
MVVICGGHCKGFGIRAGFERAIKMEIEKSK